MRRCAVGEFEQGRNTSELNYKELQEKGVFDLPYKAFQFMQSQQSKIEQLEKQQRINSECINNLVKQKADYLHKVTMAIAHLDSFDHSKAGMNQLVRSIESALEALRGES